MFQLYFLVTLLLTLAMGKDVSEDEFNREIICGDKKWDSYNEECDGTPNCTEDCLCKDGYTPDHKGGCIISCMYGDACKTGCLLPDVCEICDTEKGYTSDCQGCDDDHMWYGEGLCKKVNPETDVLGCGDFFESAQYKALTDEEKKSYEIDLGSLIEGGSVTVKTLNSTQLFINRCSRYVHPTKPYTYGQYLKIKLPESSASTYVSIELEKRYSRDDLVLAQLQEQLEGTEYGIVIQEDCLTGFLLKEKVNCLYRNGGLSEYVLSPRVVTWIVSGTTQYLFIHSKYAAAPMKDFTIYFTAMVHPCSTNFNEIDWNDIAGNGYANTFNLEHTINSRSICSKDLVKGFWFKIKGARQTILISTCNSENYDVSLDLIGVAADKTGSVNCESSTEAKCIKSRSDGCGADSKLSKMVVTLDENYTYYLYLGINEEYSAEIKLEVNTTCPLDCGEHGICSSYSGKCECFTDQFYIYKDGGCTLCGNGRLDPNEECDLSVPGYEDSQCTASCNCAYGTEKMPIGGVTKCAVPTCGDNKIDIYEECDGGLGCDHCVCVNGTTKYAKARLDCIPATCGNRKWDEGEECDGGDGCIECECQDDYFGHKQADCTRLSPAMTNFLFWGIGAIVYMVMYILGVIICLTMHYLLTKKIRQDIDSAKMVIFENTVIPFDKTNSQYIDINGKENPYFKFTPKIIDFGDKRPEINEPVSTEVTLKNTWKDPMHFTFHAGDYTKYEIMCKPFTGTIRSGEEVVLNITFMAKCTTVLNEKVPITIRYGQLQNIMKDIKKANPDLIAHNSQSSQNSENADNKSKSSDKSASQKNSQKKGSQPSKSKSTPSGSGKSNSEDSKKKKKGKSRVSKFHIYLNLQVESALSTKLDYEEIHLQHPPIGGGTFGIVYRAEWRRVDVAVKVMKTDLVGLAELLPNFMQEAEMMERIRCPYIVNFIGSVVTTDTLCLVTEFCPLGSLRKFMKTNALTDLLKIRFCQDIARGMEYLHQNDILHRDLKTDNVLVYSKNPHDPITAKVTDFGTSRSFIESSGKIALQQIGTPVYMAPEISRKDQMTLKSDVFSFAICMLEIWLGSDPYPPAKFPDSDSIIRFVGGNKRLEIPDDCLLKDIIQQSWKHKASERPSFKEVGVMLDGVFKIINKDAKSSSNKEHSGSTNTHTKDKSISESTEKKTETTTNTATQDESMEASMSSRAGAEDD
ncbi:serine-threonine protein kinase, putative [Entamoeba invadens IP1]|uniref:serine-threonine protein kinase, putative n=1 Tax=Entamoeba invadens IP1 TaxID=370355 RepID=UPI0002C3D491|nr:serine-threonine protein kinase, putative [Entamoeba invadens IP1]ELP93878.1 serine-threonine protein kinase, putative [Entamoeba invadens IP1]|eukprot:XP_004260649.1 serine-threonine protein kinase, putative [Entamoeba invadens IP1]